ncbi:nuclear transport factor 2 family protein [Rhizobium ruizarguesonis]|uniref:nuclear transport factor 2 family protein n=1 Tax=Rhizobium ruizarguesonis TaxID=2081791 RepID=UPI0037170EF4
MKPTTDDIVEINQILSLWAHLVDNHAWDRFGEVFTEDAHFDAGVFGFAPVTGIAAICHMASQDGHAKAHHTTNVRTFRKARATSSSPSRRGLVCCRAAQWRA